MWVNLSTKGNGISASIGSEIKGYGHTKGDSFIVMVASSLERESLLLGWPYLKKQFALCKDQSITFNPFLPGNP